MKYLKYVILFILLYFYFYNPVFAFLGGIGSIKLLYPLLFLLFIFNYKRFKDVIVSFRSELYVLITLLLFILLRTLFGGDSVIGYTHLVFIIEIFFIPLFLVVYTFKAGINDSKIFIRFLLVLGSFASLLSAASFLVPSIGDIIRYELMDTRSDSILYTDSYRGYGLASGLTYAYGIIQGSIIALGTFYIKDNKWFILFYPFILASILLNARTGLIVALAGVLIYLLMNHKIKSLLTVSFATLFTYVIIIKVLSTFNISSETLLWIEDFFDQLISVRIERSLTASYTLESLFSRMWVWPEGLNEWIFGRGIIIYGQSNAANSDIGYIQQLNYGGLVYVSILAIFLGTVVKRISYNFKDNSFVLLFISVFVISNLKGNYFLNGGSFRFMMFTYYFMIYMRKWQLNRCTDSS